MSVKFDDFLQEQLKDEEFRNEYEVLEQERTVVQNEIHDLKKNEKIKTELPEHSETKGS